MDSLINGFIIADYTFREKNDLSTWFILYTKRNSVWVKELKTESYKIWRKKLLFIIDMEGMAFPGLETIEINLRK